MVKHTTITVDRDSRATYEKLRADVNKAFKDRYGITKAFTVSDLFPKMLAYIETQKERFTEFALQPEGNNITE